MNTQHSHIGNDNVNLYHTIIDRIKFTVPVGMSNLVRRY